MIKFEKVSYEQFALDMKSCFPIISEFAIKEAYDMIKLPERATVDSAGYDFITPSFVHLRPTQYVTIPTGIRWICDEGNYVLMLYPRSGLGFKYATKLANTTGIIDSAYWKSDNEGHILLKMSAEKDCEIDAGKGIVQGVILPFITTTDDNATGIRNGGFGSTGK